MQELQRQIDNNSKPYVIVIDKGGRIRIGQLENAVQLCETGEVLSDLLIDVSRDTFSPDRKSFGYLLEDEIRELYLLQPQII